MGWVFKCRVQFSVVSVLTCYQIELYLDSYDYDCRRGAAGGAVVYSCHAQDPGVYSCHTEGPCAGVPCAALATANAGRARTDHMA